VELRGDVLQTLGFFDDPRGSQVLFEKLRAPKAFDRVNAILGLRNRESKDVVPALLAMLNDPDAPVRQVAHFALQRLTGQRFALSARASRAESARVAARWRSWWREKGASFVPVSPPPCRDW
jgi:HEAT repeat protein